MKNHISALKVLSKLGIIEGYSYLFLLFVAMPLKYIFKIPEPVKYGGWLHGALFVALAIAIVYVWLLRRWPFSRAFQAGFAAFIPFGTFWFDRKIKAEIQSLQAS
jgi:integral membrane protein